MSGPLPTTWEQEPGHGQGDKQVEWTEVRSQDGNQREKGKDGLSSQFLLGRSQVGAGDVQART